MVFGQVAQGRSRSAACSVIALTIFVVIALLRQNTPDDIVIQTDAEIRVVDSLPYVTFFSTRSDYEYNQPLGYYSIVNDHGKLRVIPGKEVSSTTTILHVKRTGNRRIFIHSSSFYEAGFIEAYTTANFISDYRSSLQSTYNKIRHQFSKSRSMPSFESLMSHFNLQAQYISSKYLEYGPMKNSIDHLRGFVDGYNLMQKKHSSRLFPLSLSDFLFINSFPEIHSIVSLIQNNSNTFDSLESEKSTLKSNWQSQTQLELLFSGYVSSSIIQLKPSNPSIESNIPVIWNHLTWTNHRLENRFFRTLSIVGKRKVDFSMSSVVFAGQISSMDSFTILQSFSRDSETSEIPNEKFTFTCSKLPSFNSKTDTNNNGRSNRSEEYMPIWLTNSMYTHSLIDLNSNRIIRESLFDAFLSTVNTTLEKQSPLSAFRIMLLSSSPEKQTGHQKEAKLVALEIVKGNAFLSDLTPLLLKQKFIESYHTIAFDKKAAELLNIHKGEELDAYDRNVIRKAALHGEQNLAQLLRLSTLNAFENAVSESRRSFNTEFTKVEEMIEN